MTPTLSQQQTTTTQKKNPKFTISTSFSSTVKPNKCPKRNIIKETKDQRTKKIQKHDVNLKEVDESERKNLVALNKKQTNFFSDAINAAVSFAISQTDTESAVELDVQNNFLHAIQSTLMQKVRKVKVPVMSVSPVMDLKSTTKSSSISKIMYTNISENMDATIHSLTEAINKEKMLLQEKLKLLKDNGIDP